MPSEATRFPPGRSGNPGGRPKTKPFLDALRAELAKAGDDHQALRDIAARLIAEARDGNLQAIKEIADRLDGKPTQAVDLDARVGMKSHEDWLAELGR